jgi:hypothetical protein
MPRRLRYQLKSHQAYHQKELSYKRQAPQTLLQTGGLIMVQRGAPVFAVFTFAAAIAGAQGWWEGKPYTSWSKDEVTNMLDKSPWGTVAHQAIERVGNLRAGGIDSHAGGLGGDIGSASGTEAAYDKLLFHISFVTAKPVRMALARRVILRDASRQDQTDWSKYIDQEDDQNIVLVLNLTAQPADSNIAPVISDALENIKTSDLESQTRLSTDGAKKVPLAKYDPLGENGYGVKLYFPRHLPDGSPLVTTGNKEIRFDMTIPLPKREDTKPKSVTVTAKWDLRKMLYQGKPTF